jgi:hypothetical protein
MPHNRAWPALAIAVACLALSLSAGCRNKQKQAATKLDPVVDVLLPLVDRDTKQIREALPKGAELMAKHLDEDPGSDPAGLQRAIPGARAGVHELAVSKGTFFVFVDPKGTVLRSESDPDLPAGKSLTEAVPEAKKILEADKGIVEAWGSMHELRGFEKGDDMQWIVGSPVKGKDGELKGAYVSGWSLCKYANYLEDHARRHLTQIAEDPEKATPLLYVILVKGDKAYGGGLTPDVNLEAVAKLDAVKQAGDGTYKTSVTIEEREFLVAARRLTALADDVAVVVMISAV